MGMRLNVALVPPERRDEDAVIGEKTMSTEQDGRACKKHAAHAASVGWPVGGQGTENFQIWHGGWLCFTRPCSRCWAATVADVVGVVDESF